VSRNDYFNSCVSLFPGMRHLATLTIGPEEASAVPLAFAAAFGDALTEATILSSLPIPLSYTPGRNNPAPRLVI
jgi:hypothetical protein